MRPTARPFLAVALVSAALGAAACGSDEPATPPAKEQAAPAGMAVSQYVMEAGGLRQAIDDARSDYYHSPLTTGALRRSTVKVQKAYADSVARLGDIEPPSVATDLHARLIDTWSERADQLAAILSVKRFDRSRLDDVMVQTGRDTVTDELYTLPQ
jgi:hypothetical protein